MTLFYLLFMNAFRGMNGKFNDYKNLHYNRLVKIYEIDEKIGCHLL